MANDGTELATVLREFARTLTTDFPIREILDQLMGRIVDVLPVTGAGVTLISIDLSPEFIAASNEAAMGFEQLQTASGDGPCLMAYQSGAAVEVPDLLVDDRFPRFGPSAWAAGLAAVFTFPLWHGEDCIGALDLYRDTIGPLTLKQATTAETLADVVAACLINAEARERAATASVAHLHDLLHDPLTGLPNRAMLLERLHRANQRAKRSQVTTAVFFVDLDRFKLVNDHHGHHVGDQLLLALGQRFVGLLRSGDTVARMSGDEFVFLCEDVRDEDDIDIIAARIDAAFEQPFVVDGLRLSVSASVGMAVVGPGETISSELIVRADTAMYLIKRHRGGRRHVVGDSDSALSRLPQNLEEELRDALEKDTLAIAYQPIVRTTDSMLIEVEALLRWDHPIRGPVSPLLMIGTAERSSLINLIGDWVLERSCSTVGAWLSDVHRSAIGIAVNVSARQLVSGDLLGSVERALEATNLDPTVLILEMTENLLIEDSERAMTVLHNLRHLGVRISLDDFGTGFSSLNYLTRLPIDILKIDQSLIAGIPAGPESVVVSAVTSLAHELGMVVVAEGIETREQRDEVARIGCDRCQGFFFGRPMPATAIEGIDWELPLPIGPG